ncbi:hypothetical protein [Extibacter muris]|uniref:hypothetical protein n=1 Tax=Extibacter muris TaxID=1796622 RepID=UPI001D06CA50|nr:hypothetical protein [Extibacter muris]MCB6203848.1 hypothetical protein [Extibacter muris]MCQ4665549.1 hypothetical protein [Extibacter muris]MCQ4694988.1 hypothetical protein [Extibacter muris]
MERYLQIGKVNLKHNILPHLLVTVAILCLSPLVLGVSNLEAPDTAKVLEMYVALTGIILLTPVFLPEQNKDLRDLVYSKYVRASSVYLVRILEAVLAMGVFLAIYVWMLDSNNCQMDLLKYYGGTMAEMLFLGGLGILCYGLFDNLIIGYMVPIFYYIVAMGSGDKYLKMLYPFSMAKGSYEEKIYLLIAGAVMIAAGIALRSRRSG